MKIVYAHCARIFYRSFNCRMAESRLESVGERADGDPSNRKAINSKRVSTRTPDSSTSIISPTLKPACSPAIASLDIAIVNEDLDIRMPTGTMVSVARPGPAIFDLSHTPL